MNIWPVTGVIKMIRTYNGDVYRDCDVLGPENVFYSDGEGCGTIWFKTVGDARKFRDHYGRLSGRTSGLCVHCQHSYSYGTMEYRYLPPLLCRKWASDLKLLLGIK